MSRRVAIAVWVLLAVLFAEVGVAAWQGLPRVPDVTETSLGRAELTLGDAGLRVGRVTRAPGAATITPNPFEHVTSQTPPPGAAVLPGTRIDLVVPEFEPVEGAIAPDVVGMFESDAIDLLAGRGIPARVAGKLRSPSYRLPPVPETLDLFADLNQSDVVSYWDYIMAWDSIVITQSPPPRGHLPKGRTVEATAAFVHDAFSSDGSRTMRVIDDMHGLIYLRYGVEDPRLKMCEQCHSRGGCLASECHEGVSYRRLIAFPAIP